MDKGDVYQMKKRLLALSLALVMALPLVGCGKKKTSDSDLAYIQDKGTLVIGVTAFEPMDYRDADNNWIGFDADMARAFAESLGVKAEFKEIEWDDKVLNLQDKKIDVVWNAMTLSDEVSAAMACSIPYCRNAQVVVLPTDKAAAYPNEDSLKTLSFVAEKGSAGFDALSEKGISPASVDDSIAALDRVAAGAYDACAMDVVLVKAMVGPGNNYPDLTHTVELRNEMYTVGCRKGSDLTKELDEFFKAAHADGTTQKIATEYGIRDYILDPNA